jgi:hypothetical protein
MGLGQLIDWLAGAPVTRDWPNKIHAVLKGDFVGRDVTTGNPAAGQNLGTALYPWGMLYAQDAVIGGVPLRNQIETSGYKNVSGKTRAGSNAPQFLVPAGGTSLNFTVIGTSTPLVFQTGGVTYSISADITTAMSAGPGAIAANQAVINDATAAAQAATRTWGEYGSLSNLTIGTVGANISAKVGQWLAFKLTGTTTEYFLAYVDSATSLARAFRGYFFDSTLAPVKRTTFSNAAGIQLLNLGWVFIDANATLDISQSNTNNNPVYSKTAPAAPVTNDYWFDIANQAWWQWNGSGWIAKSRHLVGLVVADNAGCKAARSFDFWSLARRDNTIELVVDSTTQIKSTGLFQMANIQGKRLSFGTSRRVWDKTASVAATTERYNAAVTASTTEYCYLSDQGQEILSDMEPYWRADLFGYYHPYNPWRAMGYETPDGSANFVLGSAVNYFEAIKLTSAVTSVSASSGNFSTNSTSVISVTNGGTAISANPASSGKPVAVRLQPAAGLSAELGASGVAANYFTLSLLRDGTLVGTFTCRLASGLFNSFVPGGFQVLDTNAPAGAHSYTLQVQCFNPNGGSTVLTMTNIVIAANEVT